MPPSGTSRRPPARALAAARTDPAAVLIKRGAELLRRLRERDEYGIFLEPVPKTVVGYCSIIASPMDLGTCLSSLRAGRFATVDELHQAVSLIWSNAMLFNHPDTIYYKQAVRLRDIATRMFSDLRRALDRERPVVGAVARTSIATTAAENGAPPGSLNISWKDPSRNTEYRREAAAADTQVRRAAPGPLRGASANDSSRPRSRARRPPRPIPVKKGTLVSELQEPVYAAAAGVTVKTTPNPTDEQHQVERAVIPSPRFPPEDTTSTRVDDSVEDLKANTAPADGNNNTSLDGLKGPSDRFAVPCFRVSPVDEKEMFVGPPPGASREVIPSLATTKRPRRAIYDKLYANHIAASAPSARRLLAALLDPRVVRAYDDAHRTLHNLDTTATDPRSSSLREGMSTIVGPLCTTTDLLSNCSKTTVTGQPPDPQLPADRFVSDERSGTANMNSLRGDLCLSSPIHSAASAVKLEPYTLYNRSGATSGERVPHPSEANCPGDGAVDACPDSDLVTCPSSLTEITSSVHLHETKDEKRVAPETYPAVQPCKRVRFSIPSTQPPLICSENEDTYNRLKESVGESLTLAVLKGDDLNSGICDSPTAESLNRVAELLKEHEIDSSFLEAYKGQELKLPLSGSSIGHVEAVGDNTSSEICQEQEVLNQNHELLMNLRRLRAAAESADSPQRLELRRLEKKYSSCLINGIASVIGKAPPRLFASPTDVACAASSLASSTVDSGIATCLPSESGEAVVPSKPNALCKPSENVILAEDKLELEMSPD